MKLKSFIDNFTATSLAIIVHVVLLGILVLSLDWSNPASPPSSRVEPVKAVVVDESEVAEEIEQIKRREEKKRKNEETETAGRGGKGAGRDPKATGQGTRRAREAQTPGKRRRETSPRGRGGPCGAGGSAQGPYR
jgi:TolA protein